MIYTINNCIRAFGYTNFDNLIADMGSVDNLKAYVIANGYADIAVAEDTELLLVDVNGKTWHTGCYGAVIEPPKPYLCFTSTGDSTVAIAQEGTPNTSANKVIQYKLNDGQWQTWDLSAITLSDGDKMYLKSDDEIPMAENVHNIYKYFVMTGSIAASGNSMSLLNFSATLVDFAFCSLYKGCTSLTAAPELPATTLKQGCYASMFQGCTSLVTAPELPATTLSNDCYTSMFKGCTSLVTAPELPATALLSGCYQLMFLGCTSLVTAPELPATTLASYCYNSMFNGCTSLTTAPELQATTLVSSCYQQMFYGCSKLNYAKALFTDISAYNCLSRWLENVSPTGTFVKSKDATWTNEQAGIPTGWTVQVEGGVTPEPEPEKDYLCFTSTGDSTVAMHQEGTPEASANKVIQYKLNNGQWQSWDFSAVTLADGDKMYLKSDDTIPMSEYIYSAYKYFVMTGSIAASGNIMSLLNFSTTLTNYAFYGLFSGCTSLVQAPALPATTLATYCYASMFNNCTSLTHAPELPATELLTSCYQNMFFNCTSLTTAPELQATTLASYCYKSMFAYCRSLTQSPALPATRLEICCYNNMFASCTSLTAAPALPATDLRDECYKGMFNNCISLTQAPELPATTLVTNCYNNMFIYCLQLNYVKAMFTTDPTMNYYLNGWLEGVSSTGTFIKNSAATWTNEQAGIPTGWTVQTASPDK